MIQHISVVFASIWVAAGMGFDVLAAEPSVVQAADPPADQVGSMRMCRSLKANFSWMVPGAEVECTRRYSLIGNPSSYSQSARQNRVRLRLGAFNAFQLGASGFKDIVLVARVMNAYDVIATTEIMPLPGPKRRSNRRFLDKLTELRRGGSISIFGRDGEELQLTEMEGVGFVKSQIYHPGYLKLLKSLRKIDRSWTLILTPWSEGERASHREFIGFFYRARRVEARSSAYCGGKVACWGRARNLDRDVLGRRPFVGAFRSGNFLFSMIVTHFRFNVGPPRLWEHIRNQLIPWEDFPTGARPLLARFAELAVTKKIMKGVAAADSDSSDVLLMGDFNLSIQDRFLEAWERVLKSLEGVRPFVDAPTSISKSSGRRMDYDHVVYNPEKITRCASNSIKVLNFMNEDKFPQLVETVENAEDEVALLEARLHDRFTIRRGRIEPLYLRRSSADEEVEDYVRRVVDAGQDWLRVLRGRPAQTPYPYRAPIELVSDHLPVGIWCNTR